MRRLRGDGLPRRSGHHTGQPAHGEQHVDRVERRHHVGLRHLLPHARQFRAGQGQRLLLGRSARGRIHVGRRIVAHGTRQRHVRRAEQHDERLERLDGLDEALHGRQRRQCRAEIRPDGADDRRRPPAGRSDRRHSPVPTSISGPCACGATCRCCSTPSSRSHAEECYPVRSPKAYVYEQIGRDIETAVAYDISAPTSTSPRPMR